MKKILSVILHDTNSDTLFSQPRHKKMLNFLKKITPKNNFLYVIDLTNYYLGKVNLNLSLYKNKKIKYFKPKNLIELYKFSKNHKIYAFGLDTCRFDTLLIFIILKFLNIKLIWISNFGFYLNLSGSSKKKSFKYRLVRLQNIFFRFLAILRIIPKVSYYFESSKIRIKNINNSISKKFDDLFFFKISYFEKIYRINSLISDDILKKKQKKTDKYIVLIDSGFFHPDIKYYGFEKKQNHNKYFTSLYKFLHNLEKTFKKKIIFAIHPKSFYHDEDINYIKKNFILSRKADQDIWKGYFILFTGGSSMVNKCILLKKKFFYLLSKRFSSKYDLLLINSLNKQIKINKIYLENYNIKNIENKLKQKLYYKNFIKNNLIYKNNEFSYKIIKNILFS